MQTDCIPNLFGFQDLGSRKVVAGFDGGMISSDRQMHSRRTLSALARAKSSSSNCASGLRRAAPVVLMRPSTGPTLSEQGTDGGRGGDVHVGWFAVAADCDELMPLR